MKREFLVFPLYAPLTSWGDVAIGDLRTAVAHPTRSGVLGLVGAALGVRREAAEKQAALQTRLRVAVASLSDGHLLRDFQTVQSPPKSRISAFERENKRPPRTRAEELDCYTSKDHPMVTRRDYFVDTVSLVALWNGVEPGEDLETIDAALRAPTYRLSAGRRSCAIALPLVPVLVNANHPVEALEDAKAVDPAVFAQLGFERIVDFGTRPVVLWEGASTEWSRGRATQEVRYRDDPGSRLRWQFRERRVLQGRLSKTVGELFGRSAEDAA